MKELTGAAKDPEAPLWQPAGELYPRLIDFDATAMGLVAVSGMAIVWHFGVRPQWLRVIRSCDLAASVVAAKVAPAILGFQLNGDCMSLVRANQCRAPRVLPHTLVAIVRPMFVGPLLPGEVEIARDTPTSLGSSDRRLGDQHQHLQCRRRRQWRSGRQRACFGIRRPVIELDCYRQRRRSIGNGNAWGLRHRARQPAGDLYVRPDCRRRAALGYRGGS